MYPGGGSGGGFNIPPGPPGGYPNTQQPPAGFGVPPGNVINFVCFSTLSHICFVLFFNVSARVSQVDLIFILKSFSPFVTQRYNNNCPFFCLLKKTILPCRAQHCYARLRRPFICQYLSPKGTILWI